MSKMQQRSDIILIIIIIIFILVFGNGRSKFNAESVPRPSGGDAEPLIFGNNINNNEYEDYSYDSGEYSWSDLYIYKIIPSEPDRGCYLSTSMKPPSLKVDFQVPVAPPEIVEGDEAAAEGCEWLRSRGMTFEAVLRLDDEQLLDLRESSIGGPPFHILQSCFLKSSIYFDESNHTDESAAARLHAYMMNPTEIFESMDSVRAAEDIARKLIHSNNIDVARVGVLWYQNMIHISGTPSSRDIDSLRRIGVWDRYSDLSVRNELIFREIEKGNFDSAFNIYIKSKESSDLICENVYNLPCEQNENIEYHLNELIKFNPEDSESNLTSCIRNMIGDCDDYYIIYVDENLNIWSDEYGCGFAPYTFCILANKNNMFGKYRIHIDARGPMAGCQNTPNWMTNYNAYP